MTALALDGPDALRGAVGADLGPTDWLEITQERVDAFAEATGDHQWIHTDPERAARESPFGGPIAHGHLTLSLVPFFLPQLATVTGFSMGVNYGSNKVRFPAPVPVGKAARKRHLVRWFRDALADATDDAVRVDFLAARDYASVANVIRSRARALERRDASKSHAEAIRLLDNKGHFLNIVDQCVEKKEEEEASAAAAAVAETNRAHWENVKRRHRAKARPRPGSHWSPYDRVGVVNADP